MTAGRPYLFDCTRLVAQAWAGRQPSGIDRVCHAYRTWFAPQAQAVVQYRGKAAILTPHHSDLLFGLLEAPQQGFRSRVSLLLAGAAATVRKQPRTEGAIYLNVSHTDFDLERHIRWVNDCQVRAVYLLHDLIPLLHPQWSTAHRVTRHRGRVLGALRSASGIIANSRATADDLHQFASREAIDPPPILSAPLAAADLPVTDRQSSTDAPYFVCVSTIEARKNHDLLLRVWQSLSYTMGDATPRLVLVGQWGMQSCAVRHLYQSDSRLSRFVTVCNDSTDAQLAGWMRGAAALLAPSRAEGFGLPVAEALRLGVPVIASDLPAFREIGGDIPTYLDASDEAGWFRSVCEFTVNGPDRRRQINRLADYRAPLWRDHFALVEDWLEGLPTTARNSDMPRHAYDRNAAGHVLPALTGSVQ